MAVGCYSEHFDLYTRLMLVHEYSIIDIIEPLHVQSIRLID